MLRQGKKFPLASRKIFLCSSRKIKSTIVLKSFISKWQDQQNKGSGIFRKMTVLGRNKRRKKIVWP